MLQIHCISPAKIRLMKENRDTLEAEAAAEVARKRAAKAEREAKKNSKATRGENRLEKIRKKEKNSSSKKLQPKNKNRI